MQCIERALGLFAKTGKWNALMKRAMKQDFSVLHMSNDYIKLYKTILTTDETVA